MASLGIAQEPVRFMTQTSVARGTSTCISPDGKLLAICKLGEIALWNLEHGRAARMIGGLSRYCSDAVFSPDSRYLLTAGYDESAILWDCLNGKVLWKIKPFDNVESVGFDPKGRYAICANFNNCVAVDLATKKIVQHIQDNKKRKLNAGKTTHDGVYVALWKDEGRLDKGKFRYYLARWNPVSGKLLSKKRSEYFFRFSALSEDGVWGLIERDEGQTQINTIWNVAKGRVVAALPYKDDLLAPSFSPDGKYLLALEYPRKSLSASLSVWSVSSGKLIMKKPYGSIAAPVWLPSENKAMCFPENSIETIQIPTGDTVASIRTFQAAGRGSLVNSETLRWDTAVWDVARGQVISHAYENKPYFFSISLDGSIALRFREEDKGVEVFSVKDFKKLSELERANQAPLFLSPSGKLAGRLFNIPPSEEYRIQIWNTASGHICHDIVLDKSLSYVHSLAISPSDNLCVVSTRSYDEKANPKNYLQFHDLRKSGKVLMRHSREAFHTAFSPDGSKLAYWQPQNNNRISSIQVCTTKDPKITYTLKDAYLPLSFNNDGTCILAPNADGTRLQRWNIASKRMTNTFALEKHYDAYQETPDGKHILGFSGDGTMTVWSLERNLLLYHALLDRASGEFLAWIPEGYYQGSDGAARELCHIARGIDTYPMDNFFEQFYNPAMVQARAMGVQIEAETLSNVLAQSPPPTVAVLSPKAGVDGIVAAQEAHIEITVAARDTGGGVREIRLYHNGKRVGADAWRTVAEFQIAPGGGIADRGISTARTLSSATAAPNTSGGDAAPPVQPGDKTETFKVQLLNGENVIRATAMSSEMIESEEARIVVRYQGAAIKQKVYIVAVGVNEYRDSNIHTLTFCQADAAAFAEELANSAHVLFGGWEIAAFYNAEATRESVLAALADLETKAGVGDMVVFYFAGHGVSLSGSGRFYLITHETEVLSPELSSVDHINGGISELDIGTALMRIPALKQVLFFDACQSGGTDFSAVFREASQDIAAKRLSRVAGTWVFTACGKTESAWEFGEHGHGLFTYALLNGLKGRADSLPADGIVMLQEIADYIVREVSNLAAARQRQQVPQVRKGHSDFALSASHRE